MVSVLAGVIVAEHENLVGRDVLRVVVGVVRVIPEEVVVLLVVHRVVVAVYLSHTGLVLPVGDGAMVDKKERPALDGLADGTPGVDHRPALVFCAQLGGFLIAEHPTEMSIGGDVVVVDVDGRLRLGNTGSHEEDFVGVVARDGSADRKVPGRDVLRSGIGSLNQAAYFWPVCVSDEMLAYRCVVAHELLFREERGRVLNELVSIVRETWPGSLLSDVLNLDIVGLLGVQIRRAVGRVKVCCLAIFGAIEKFDSPSGKRFTVVCSQSDGVFGLALLGYNGSSHCRCFRNLSAEEGRNEKLL